MTSLLPARTDENHKTGGCEIILGALDAQPIFSIPPISKNNEAETYIVKEVTKIVSQLAQLVGSHILHSVSETANLKAELRESVSTVEAKLDINSTAVKRVEDKLNHLTELLQKRQMKGLMRLQHEKIEKEKGKK